MLWGHTQVNNLFFYFVQRTIGLEERTQAFSMNHIIGQQCNTSQVEQHYFHSLQGRSRRGQVPCRTSCTDSQYSTPHPSTQLVCWCPYWPVISLLWSSRGQKLSEKTCTSSIHSSFHLWYAALLPVLEESCSETIPAHLQKLSILMDTQACFMSARVLAHFLP